jgi:cytidylate kinase
MASRVAAIPEVRRVLLDKQRAFCQAPGLLADGRDMGTVVFPAAPLKVFLTASPDERARRRYNQLKEMGLDASLSTLVEAIRERDRRDAERPISPMVPAKDSVVLDSTSHDIEKVVAMILSLAQSRGLN